MIDYTKILVLNVDIQRLFSLSKLDFKSEISKNTGEINENSFIAKYYHCEINIKIIKPENEPERTHIIFTGSIHKMWNELNGIKAPNYNENKPYKGFNGNEFSINNIVEVRNHLEDLFDCNASQMIFQNIEFGVNIILDFNPILYLKGLLYHKNILFDFSHSGNNAQAVHQWFIFKIYNKSFQYKMSKNVLRVELKIIKMIALKESGIKTFADINQNTLQKAQELLLKRFNEVMHYDYTIEKSILTKREKQLLDNYSNPRYWIVDLKPIHRDRHKKKLTEITVKYSKNLHQHIKNETHKKCVIINQLSKNTKCVITNHSSIWINTTQNDSKINNIKNTTCKVTGLNILMQKDDSILLSHTGLKYYYNTDRNTFEQLKRKYLTKVWHNSSFKLQIKELAHNIRNHRSNQHTKQNRLYQPQQLNFLTQFGI